MWEYDSVTTFSIFVLLLPSRREKDVPHYTWHNNILEFRVNLFPLVGDTQTNLFVETETIKPIRLKREKKIRKVFPNNLEYSGRNTIRKSFVFPYLDVMDRSSSNFRSSPSRLFICYHYRISFTTLLPFVYDVLSVYSLRRLGLFFQFLSKGLGVVDMV